MLLIIQDECEKFLFFYGPGPIASSATNHWYYIPSAWIIVEFSMIMLLPCEVSLFSFFLFHLVELEIGILNFILDPMVVPTLLSDGDVATFLASCCDMHVSLSRALYELEFSRCRCTTQQWYILTEQAMHWSDYRICFSVTVRQLMTHILLLY